LSKGAKPLAYVTQRHYKTQKSPAIVDGRLDADLRAFCKTKNTGVRYKTKRENVEKVKTILASTNLDPEEASTFLNSVQSSTLLTKQKAGQVLLRPMIDLKDMINQIPKVKDSLSGFDNETLEQAEIQIKYDTYIEKEKELVSKMSQLEDLVIPDNFNYEKLVSLSNEARQKFTKIKPRTLGQASRISGVNPSDVQILMVFMGR
jgi:tRNA uridine 5-carboxymethylaminomethyl modification enzyme